mgnify:FL=1
MRSKLSRQIFTTISVTLILVILLACGGYLLASYLNVRSTLSSFSQQYARQLEDMDYVYELVQSANMFPKRSIIIFIYSSDGNLITSNAPPPENANLGDLQTAASGGEVFNTVEYDGITMLSLTTRVNVESNIDSNGRIFLRVLTTADWASENFWIFFGSSIAVALLLILLAMGITNLNLKRSMRPLEAVQKGLNDINNGNFHGIAVSTDYEEFRGIVSQISDISEKISASLSSIKYEQRKAAFLLDNIGQGIIALSDTRGILTYNNAVLRILGLQGNIAGQRLEDVIDDESIIAAVARTQENGEKDGCEFRRAGNVYRVETLIASGSWFETYNTFALLLTFTDITQESRSADIRSEFFANASHELKTPLTVIKGYSELLTIPGQSEKNISRCVSEIQTNADKMGVLINDMLFISRLDANIVNEEKAVVDLGGMCRSICDDMGGAAQNAGVTIFCEGDGTAECYPKMMTTAITNLVSNAVKYNREGGSVWVKVYEDGEYVCISVKDNGIGISDEDKPRVFERFFKADKAHTRNDELSTGLGLAIVKHIIVNMHGGEITLESEEGKGSEFIVKLAKGKEAEKNDISDETQTGN